MANFRYNLHNVNKDVSPVILSVTFGGKRIKIHIGISVTTKLWDQSKQRVKPTTPEGKMVNGDLKAKMNNAQAALTRLINQEKDINTSSVRKAIESALHGNITEAPIDFLSFVNDYINGLEHKINIKTGTKFNPSTIQVHNQTLNVLKEFQSDKGIKLDFDTIDMKFYKTFHNWATIKKNYKNNTFGKHIKNLKTWLEEATKQGLNENLTFRQKDFFRPTETSPNVVLNNDEIGKLERLDLSQKQDLDIIRDIFLTLYYTGLRYSDLKNLKASNIIGESIALRAQKTGKSNPIPLIDPIKKILDKYNGEFPPLRANPYFNRKIKEVCQLAGIDEVVTKYSTDRGTYTEEQLKKYELVSAHTSRRSMATNAFKRGMPPIAIMQITGHATEQQLFQYINISKEEAFEVYKQYSHLLNGTN